MFWERLNSLCDEYGTKPTPLAIKLGLSNSAPIRWKKGAIPSGDVLIKIADYFSVSVDYLLGRTDVRSVAGKTEFASDAEHLSLEQKENTPLSILCAKEVVERIENHAKSIFFYIKDFEEKLDLEEGYFNAVKSGCRALDIDVLSEVCNELDISANLFLFGRVTNKKETTSRALQSIIDKCRYKGIELSDLIEEAQLPFDIFELMSNDIIPVGIIEWVIQNHLSDHSVYIGDIAEDLRKAHQMKSCKYVVMDKDDMYSLVKELEKNNPGREFHSVSIPNEAEIVSQTDDMLLKDKSCATVKNI